MTSVYKHKRGGWYVIHFLPGGQRVRLYLGKVTKAQAETFSRRLQVLVVGNSIGAEPPEEIANWLSLLKPTLIKRLDEYGMLRTWHRPSAAPTLKAYWDEYVERRKDFSGSTLKGFKTAWKHVDAAFAGANLTSINVSSAKQFARDLQMAVAPSHAKKIVERVNQVFNDAIEAKKIEANPFAGIKIRPEIDEQRQAYVPEQVAVRVLEKFTSLEGRALFALARWCGLRVPHEPLALTWSDVDWELSRLKVPNETKTGFRVVPLFPQALKELENLDRATPGGTVWIFNRARASAGTTWRNWATVALNAAHVPSWPKFWMNLRASCRTDLEDKYPSHVCDAWLGHSLKVAKDHYLRVKPEHWIAACGKAPPAVELVNDNNNTAHGAQ